MKTLTLVDAIGYIDDDLISGAVEYERKPFAARLFGDRTWRGALKKAAVVILALLIGAGVWLATDEGARAAFRRWWREVYENSVIYRFAGDTEGTLPLYAPTWVPEGFELKEDLINKNRRIIIYLNENSGDSIAFDYFFMDTGAQIELQELQSNTEVPDPEHLLIQNKTAEFYSANTEFGDSNLIWFDETENIVFSIGSSLSRDDILRIAESVALETQAQPALPLYAPTWVPEGFELEDDYTDQEARNMYYAREADGKMVAFDCSYMHSGTAIQIFNPEGVPDSEEAMVNGMKAYFYPAGGSSKMASLIWIDEAQNIVFSIDSGLSKADILRIAESVRIEG